MSHYRRANNDLDDDLAFGELPPNRWDLDRFKRAQEERDRHEHPPRSREIHVDDRPRGREHERRFHDEPSSGRVASRIRREAFDTYFGQSTHNDRALQPYPAREAEREREREIIIDIERGQRPAPPRPELIRRQSSLDTFNRRPIQRTVEKEVYIRRSPSPERIRYETRPGPPPAEQEVEIIHEREREISTRRRAKSDIRSVASGPRSVLSARSQGVESSSGGSSHGSFAGRGASPPNLPGRKGYTRLPKGRFTRSAVERFGVPYVDEPDTFKLLRALDKAMIDQILAWSHDQDAVETRKTTYYDTSRNNDHYEAIRTEWINPPSMRAPSPPRERKHSKHSKRHRAPSAPPPAREDINIHIQQQQPPPPVAQYYAPPQPQWIPPPPQPQPVAMQVTETVERSHDDIAEQIRRLTLERDQVRIERGVPAFATTSEQVLVTQPPWHQQVPVQNTWVQAPAPVQNYQVIPYRPRSLSPHRERKRSRSPKRGEIIRVAKDKKGRLALIRSKR